MSLPTKRIGLDGAVHDFAQFRMFAFIACMIHQRHDARQELNPTIRWENHRPKRPIAAFDPSATDKGLKRLGALRDVQAHHHFIFAAQSY